MDRGSQNRQLPFNPEISQVTARRIRLTDEGRQHILDHPEMAGLELAIEETVRSPEKVVQSLADPSAQLLYRFFQETIVGPKWLCVVVKYTLEDAFVLTAYFTDKPKKGEQVSPNE